MMWRIFKKNEAPFFIKETFTEDISLQKNPGRGWYRLYTFAADTDIIDKELIWSLHKEDALAFLLIDIGMYHKAAIPQEGLAIISHILHFFMLNEKEMILRFVYDKEGRGMLKEPPYFELVQEHMCQIGEIIQEYAPFIYVVQGIFVGNWGEMHGSKFLAPAQVALLVRTLWEACGKTVRLAVRKPAHWRMIYAEEDFAGAYGGAKGGKTPQVGLYDGVAARNMPQVGLYDDALLASDDDLGTFGMKPRREAAWTEAWLPHDELKFIEKLGAYLPIGGETAEGQGGVIERSFEETEEILRRMRISYLNCVHDVGVLESWRQSICPKAGAWQGASLYEYIGAHIGYRFVVRDAEVKKKKRGGASVFVLMLTIENTGFAPCFEEGALSLCCVGEGEKCEIPLAADIRTWESGKSVSISHEISGKGAWYLRLLRMKDKKEIAFANQREQEGVKLGVLNA